MRDIVATIQPEQDSIVRASLDQSLCIQGAPGTGKTAIGLHRAAYLLYAFRRPAQPLWRTRRRAERQLLVLHRRRIARSRRDRCRSNHSDRAGVSANGVDGPRGRQRFGGAGQGGCADGGGAAPGGVEPSGHRHRTVGGAEGGLPVAGRCVPGSRSRRRTASARCALRGWASHVAAAAGSPGAAADGGRR